MWVVYLLLGLLAGIVVAALITLLLRALFGCRKKQEEPVMATEVAAATAAPVPIPALIPVVVAAEETEPEEVELFLLSRQDVLDHIEEMRAKPKRFLLAPNINERETENLPDYLKCGEICFSIVFERNDCVHNIAVRLDEETAKAHGELHPVEHTGYLSGNDWYNLAIDQSYKSKREVYEILDASYDYVFRMQNLLTEEEAKAEFIKIEKEFADNTAEAEKAASIAELNYLRALEKFKNDYYTDFAITRREIIADTRAIGNEDIVVLERVEPQMPVSLKYKGKTYAILYGTDRGVMMVVKLSDGFADKLAVKHPEIRRAKFPAGANWYYVPVDGAFDGKEAVYTVLNASYRYVLIKYGSEAQIEAVPKLIYTDFADHKTEDDAEYLKSLEDFKANYYSDLTRRGIMEYTCGLNNADITVVDRPMEPQLPVSLKYQGKTYAMLYGTESGVVMIVKLAESYAEKLSEKHPNINKAKFPAGANWFSVPLGKSFTTQETIHSILNNSIKFLDQYKAKKQKETEAKQKAKEAKAKQQAKVKELKAKAEQGKASQTKTTQAKKEPKSPYSGI